jgi:hypothetical protein
METKARANSQPRNPEVTANIFFTSGSPRDGTRMREKTAEAMTNPTINLGKRNQISAALGFSSPGFLGISLPSYVIFHVRSEALVVCVFDDLANVDVLVGEVQRVVRARISWEPVLAVNLFPVGFKAGKEILLAFFRISGTAFPYVFTI